MKIDLQTCFITRGVESWVADSTMRKRKLMEAFLRLSKGDFGILCAEDRLLNLQSIKLGEGRIMGIYIIDNTKIWIISYLGYEGYTTALLPEEY